MTKATTYFLDTHALIWFLESSPRLGVNAKAVLNDPNSQLFLSTVALAEACWIVERGRTLIPAVADLLADVDADSRITVLPFERMTLDVSLTLKSIGEMHDRQIVASALVMQNRGETVALLTKDANIVASGLVPVVW